ncbi:MAG TPA: metalloregulator ArsR/SmtB family transcription factor [Acidobacteriaceae bacterium]|nr:metalloregulator ArsR/SmtB family transcription factor [Acidobacteriaceae bacterium]
MSKARPKSIDLSRAFLALADPTRRAILARLTRGPLTVMEIAYPFAVTQPAITKQLNVLERAGLIERVRKGRQRECHAVPTAVDAVTGWLETYRRAACGDPKDLERILKNKES